MSGPAVVSMQSSPRFGQFIPHAAQFVSVLGSVSQPLALFPSQFSHLVWVLAKKLHTIVPQLPDPSHIPAPLVTVHASPAATGMHVPVLPHVVHWGHEVDPQQNPLGQLPLVHSVPDAHERPLGFVASHVDPLQ